MMTKDQVAVSFELFPPKTEEGFSRLMQAVIQLQDHAPSYFSVTYGAGGSTQESTLRLIETLLKETHARVMPHISCIGMTRHHMAHLLDHYLSMGIDQVIALRGDLPTGSGAALGDFHYASDLVRFIRAHCGRALHVKVAVYPECHPQSANMHQDLKHFKGKVDSGADAAVTQYFYAADAYRQLREDCALLDIDIPITPGIMPITNLEQLARFSALCGAEVPYWIKRRLEAYGDDQESIGIFGTDVVSKLCQQLIYQGADSLHFYTLNKAEPTIAVLQQLDLKLKQRETIKA